MRCLGTGLYMRGIVQKIKSSSLSLASRSDSFVIIGLLSVGRHPASHRTKFVTHGGNEKGLSAPGTIAHDESRLGRCTDEIESKFLRRPIMGQDGQFHLSSMTPAFAAFIRRRLLSSNGYASHASELCYAISFQILLRARRGVAGCCIGEQDSGPFIGSTAAALRRSLRRSREPDRKGSNQHTTERGCPQ